MKRVILLLAIFALLVPATGALGQVGSESQVFFLDPTGAWQPNPADVNLRLARLFRTGETVRGECNKKFWDIPVFIHASVAQWIEFRLDWTRWDWYVRKPGCFAGNSIEAFVASNSDVFIDYQNFEDLMPIITGNTPIPIWYSFEMSGGGVQEADARGWVRAADLNADDDLLLDSRDLHFGISWKLWNKICVVECNSACEYFDEALITLTLNNQKPWIDFATGNWNL